MGIVWKLFGLLIKVELFIQYTCIAKPKKKPLNKVCCRLISFETSYIGRELCDNWDAKVN